MTEREWAKPTIENGWLEMPDGSGCDLDAIRIVRVLGANTRSLPEFEVVAFHARITIEAGVDAVLTFACPDEDVVREVACEINAAIRAHRAGK